MYDIPALYCKGTSLLFKCKTENAKDHETTNETKPKRQTDATPNPTATPQTRKHRKQQTNAKRTTDQTDQRRTPKSIRKAKARSPEG